MLIPLNDMDVDQISLLELSNRLKQCESDIVEGKRKLCLTASLLQRLNYAIQQIEYDRISLKKPIIAQDNAIQYLQELVHATPKLKVTQRIKRETWRVDISKFTNLRYLELVKIPLHLVEGLRSAHSKLQVFICERCTDSIEEILGASSDYVWQELHTAKLCYNDFALLCPFTSALWLKYLDLSYNKIEDKLSLQTLKNLRYLKLSFNFLTSVPVLSDEVCNKLTVLLVNNNYIQELSAISMFNSLEVLDASNNVLADHTAISPILCLPNLRNLNLLNNPISYHPHHRFHTCSYLNKGVIPNEFILNGSLLNLLEQNEIGRRGETCRPPTGSKPKVLTCLPQSSIKQVSARSATKNTRDADIEESSSLPKSKSVLKEIETNKEHLETKKQIEEVRERYGGDHWLHSHAGSFIQDIMGLQKPCATSTPLGHHIFPLPSSSPVANIDKADPSTSSMFASSASNDYITALTTEAIFKQITSNEITASETSDEKEMELPQGNTISTDQLEEGLGNKLPEPETVSRRSSSARRIQGSDHEDILEENDDGQLWLVQCKNGDGVLVEMFLILTNTEVRERGTNTGRTTARWSIESILSCDKINNEPPTIHITFNTIRKSYKERTYIMEYQDAQNLLKRVRLFLEARSLTAMHQVPYRCMKCSSMFSVEVQPTVLSSNVLAKSSAESKLAVKCPTCGSSLVVQMDEAPLPSSGKKEEVSSSPLHQTPSDSSIDSAGSAEHSGANYIVSTNEEGTQISKRCDSDIEVISNPSQSSIEVLEVQARLPGSLIDECSPQPNTQLEIQSNTVGLTESSSSGSLTDSVCTAYESNPVVVRRWDMSDVCEETTPTPTSVTYNTLLEGLIQSIGTKIALQSSPSNKSTMNNNVEYSFKDFSQVDHRIKFYFYQNLFKDDNEELLFIIRAFFITSDEIVPGCFVVSSNFLYILHVVGAEIGDDASEWFQLQSCHDLAELTSIFALPWNLGTAFVIGSSIHVLLFKDTSHTCNFFNYLASLSREGSSFLLNISVEEIPSPKLERDLQEMLSCSMKATDSYADSTIRHIALCKPISASEQGEISALNAAALLITSTDLLLVKPSISWLLPSTKQLPHLVAVQKVGNIIDLSLDGLDLQLHYLKEPENKEEVWNIELPSIEAVDMIVESIRSPWERLFSVPLQLNKKNKSDC